ncbi:hypothetical protein ASF83_07480 [Plantibacter sp. Leaf171]|uniref:hypothetical protein n=1 Tax=unclassified Plantibacter TaxID=2624265 RepID=UPI0006F2C8F9|nr:MULTISPECIES: hypothetical protein [unclassified Plantibacter]KQM15761.1 hypothetical protein ASE44_07495 [Plantibacter sp. Leaf1]KQR58904.1 hypothetical protein ASF83_07480 [Plantibacter sp. Leaf171]
MTEGPIRPRTELIDHAPPVRLGTVDAPLRFSGPREPGGRHLIVDGIPAFELSFPCGTCALLFRRLDAGARALAEATLHHHLDEHVPAIDDLSLRELVSTFLPAGTYLPLLLSVEPVLVAPGGDLDYFSHEQVVHRGIDPNLGAPEDPATEYYRGSTRTIGDHETLFEFLVPMLPPSRNDRARVDAYETAFRAGGAATVLAVSVVDRTQPSDSVEAHTGLVHVVLDGHHKLEAAARLGVAVAVLAFVSVEASLADEATVTGLPELLAR